MSSEQLKTIRQLVAELTEFDPGETITKLWWNETQRKRFETHRYHVQRLAKHLELEKLEHDELSWLESYARHAHQVVQQCEQMKSPGHRPPDSNQTLDSIDHHRKNFAKMSLGMFLAWTTFDDEVRAGTKNIEQLESLLNSATDTVRRTNEEVEKILSDAKLQASKRAVDANSKIFLEQADCHRDRSKYWFGSLFVVGAMIVAYCLYGVPYIYNSISTPQPQAAASQAQNISPNTGQPVPSQQANIQSTGNQQTDATNSSNAFDLLRASIASAAGLSVLYFLLVQCSRMHTANAHNAAVNRHRHQSLQTFETFLLGASDNDTKNAILLQAAQCIFSPQPTGFTSSKDGDSQSNTQVVEIFRALSSKPS